MDSLEADGQLGSEVLSVAPRGAGLAPWELGRADVRARGARLRGRFLSLHLHADGLPPVLLTPRVSDRSAKRGPPAARGPLSSHSLCCSHVCWKVLLPLGAGAGGGRSSVPGIPHRVLCACWKCLRAKAQAPLCWLIGA